MAGVPPGPSQESSGILCSREWEKVRTGRSQNTFMGMVYQGIMRSLIAEPDCISMEDWPGSAIVEVRYDP